ncbi:MAG TPA: alpha/beta fold hydrolase [Candidatus Binataceae bacterium]|nr:alpha/beta fold hydrolase [Candidatus Binataceae bacterium]
MVRFLLIRLARLTVIAALTAYGGLFAMQRQMLYPGHTHRIPMGKPEDYQLKDFSEVHLSTDDGVRIMGWVHPPAKGMPVILFFHGNGEQISNRAELFRQFADDGYGVFALEYRGYGNSDGSPSEEGLYSDARAACHLLKNSYPDSGIIAFGESLGSGIAVEMAKEFPVTGLVLESAYTSIPNRASEIFWFMPGVQLLARDRFDSISKIGEIHCPILILHGDLDTIIPIAHGEKLSAAATSRKQFIVVHGAGHIVPDPPTIKAVNDFFGESSHTRAQ